VPGTVKGFHEAWLRYGRVPWSNLVAPSIAICQNGFQLEAGMANIVARLESTVRSFPSLRSAMCTSFY
jgi:gamma-glutamyltranspeptidase/glutathione hydrolase/leukotriene-C4 hydrolase